jgi:hypothetical protein
MDASWVAITGVLNRGPRQSTWDWYMVQDRRGCRVSKTSQDQITYDKLGTSEIDQCHTAPNIASFMLSKARGQTRRDRSKNKAINCLIAEVGYVLVNAHARPKRHAMPCQSKTHTRVAFPYTESCRENVGTKRGSKVRIRPGSRP